MSASFDAESETRPGQRAGSKSGKQRERDWHEGVYGKQEQGPSGLAGDYAGMHAAHIFILFIVFFVGFPGLKHQQGCTLSLWHMCELSSWFLLLTRLTATVCGFMSAIHYVFNVLMVRLCIFVSIYR